MAQTSFEHLPDEILEKIFENICPYKDYKCCSAVCWRWRRLIHGVAKRKWRTFMRSVKHGKLTWSRLNTIVGQPPISDRYSHAACYLNGGLYVFGGCTASNTTFNDLWKLDLSSKSWVRPIACGTYPSPKACSTLTVWRNQLVLFGGWSQPTPFPLHQAAQFFNQLHLYDTEENTWTAVTVEPAPPAVAGHSACMMKDKMVVFGGSRQHGTSSEALWELNMLTQRWRELTVISEDKPLPRYGASMWTINDHQAVLVGGCGGPNMKFVDCWRLTIDNNMAVWEEMEVRNGENSCPPPLWCHPMCKVGNLLVVLSKTSLPISQQVLQQISQRKSLKCHDTPSRTCYSSSSSDDEELRTRAGMAAAGGARSHQPRRLKQLEMLEKYERRLRTHKSLSQSRPVVLLKQPMFLHSLDISTLSDGYVSWNPPNVTDVSGEVAEETFFYSLTEGRGELILFGGVHPERDQGMQRASSSGNGSQHLNDSVFIIRGKELRWVG